MSSAVEAEAMKIERESKAGALWRRQVLAIMRLEIRKNFWGRRALLMYFLAMIPVLLLFALTTLDPRAHEDISRDWGQAKIIFANIYEGLILRTVVFFGCAWIFMNLFRGEVVDKSLHYYFLAPLKRSVLVAGKYISGLTVSAVLFLLSIGGSLFFLYLARGYPANVHYLLDGGGASEVGDYLGITLLACIGYGAVFMAIGLFFRNPVVPALIVYAWEWLNFLLPPSLKRISIIHYLHSLVPVPVSEGPFATVVEPTSAWLAIPGLLLLTLLVLVIASRRIRRMEIGYGNE
jgi:ABC-type transport system involved in multi-copper enzyme maturation permease subunit